ncbi:MAG: endonuclease III [Eubacteriales bacterium]|nr:endonuclease III [Eubacteriales bacterium]MDY3332394.1 endonuclease III [Gallibacter sp.]
MKKTDIINVLDALDRQYPDAECALDFKDLYQLITAVALSAQTTDKRVNIVTPTLFKKYPNIESLANAKQTDVENIIKTVGMYKSKAKNLIAMAKMLKEDYKCQVPEDDNELIKLPGVGRKTANVVMSVGFGHQRLAVDTHVFRVANRLGIVNEKTPLATELAMLKKVPDNRLSKTHHSLIFHGRQCCDARKPQCENCVINQYCKYYKTLLKRKKNKL